MRAPGPLARAVAVAAVVLVADQVTKGLVRGSLGLEQTRHLLPGVTLVHEQNSGVAFSLLTGSEAGVIAITLIVISALLVFFVRHRERRWIWLACGLIVGGGLGHLVGRLRAGLVQALGKPP